MRTSVRAILLSCSLLTSVTLSAQTHNWTIDPKDYGYDCEVNAVVFMGSVEVTTGTLGAFVGSTCRGFADGIYFPGTGKTIFSVRCYSDTTLPETITFRYFNPVDNSFHNINETVTFVPDVQLGNALSPLLFHRCDPVEILSQPSNRSMCAVTGNASFSITAGGDSPYTYQWKYNTGTEWINVTDGAPSGAIYSGQNTTTLGVSGITAAGEYQFTCFITNCHEWSNITSNVATLTVNSLPVATASNNGPVCTGNSVNLTGGPSGMAGYLWTGPNGFTSTLQNPQVSASASTLMAGTYTLIISDANGCTDTELTTVTVTVLPTATISYGGNPFCRSLMTAQPVTLSGTGSYTGGTFSSAPAGLSINPSTGAIMPGTSTAGTYTVTYTIPASGGCSAVPVTTGVTITAVPTATISYSGNPFCRSLTTAQSVTLTGTGAYAGGTYSSAPAGLSINTSTGAITPGSSIAGVYTVTYTIPASGGCSAVPVNTVVTITAVPTAIISYAGNPFCRSVTTAQPVTLMGTGPYTGGTFSSAPEGLSINSSTGAITPGTSAAGSYTVIYIIPASGGCTAIPVTTGVTITSVPTATISYGGNPFCRSITTSQPVTITGTGAYTGGTYSSIPSGLSINSSTGAIIPGTSTAGTYTVTYTIPESGGCSTVPVTTGVTITAVPTAAISYAGNPFCRSLTTSQPATITGTGAYTGGAYSSIPAGLSINTSTGAIIPSTSTSGTYTVTYTIPASGGCSAVPVNTVVTITVVPTATISYAGNPFCRSVTTAQPVTLMGTGAYAGGTYSSSPSGLSINASTGAITPGTSTTGTFTVTYTIPSSGGCGIVTTTTPVTINPLPAAITGGNSVCVGSAITLNSSPAGGTWSSSVPAVAVINSSSGLVTGVSQGISVITYRLPTGCSVSIEITVLPADWHFVPGDFDYDGTVTAMVNMESKASVPGFLAAYSGEDCRGYAGSTYNSSTGNYIYELICYSNEVSGDVLTFKYFDPVKNVVYDMDRTVDFVPGMDVGTESSPVIMEIGVNLNMSFPGGWTWFSVNIALDNMTLNFILSSLASPGDYIKSQTSSSTYYAGYGWFGSLNTIEPTKLYKIKVQNTYAIKFSGKPVDVGTTPISLASGWNWIGYLPQSSLPIKDALATLSFVTGDYIKDQFFSSTYYSSIPGWFGNLNTMSPAAGYMLRITNSGTLRYPQSGKKGDDNNTEKNEVQFNLNEFEFNGSLTAKVMMDGVAGGSENDLLYAYVNNEIRGVIGGDHFKPGDTWLYSLMIHSNVAQGEIVEFKYFDADKNKYYDCKETITFTSDMVMADALKPLELNFSDSDVRDNFAEELKLRTYPNPFGQDLNIEYDLNNSCHVRITVLDVFGRVIRTLLDQTQEPDHYLFRWNSDLPPYGIYFIKFEAGHRHIIQKAIVR